jgi:predicted nucleotidyltransferase
MEPLDQPHDLVIARAVIEQRALTRAVDGMQLLVDLTLVMAGFEFEEVWSQRRIFRLDGVELPVARLGHIVTSKAKAGRDKDRLFLKTYEQVLDELMQREEAHLRRRNRGASDMPDSQPSP